MRVIIALALVAVACASFEDEVHAAHKGLDSINFVDAWLPAKVPEASEIELEQASMPQDKLLKIAEAAATSAVEVDDSIPALKHIKKAVKAVKKKAKKAVKKAKKKIAKVAKKVKAKVVAVKKKGAGARNSLSAALKLAVHAAIKVATARVLRAAHNAKDAAKKKKVGVARGAAAKAAAASKVAKAAGAKAAAAKKKGAGICKAAKAQL